MGVVNASHAPPSRTCATLRTQHLDRGPDGVLVLSGEADLATRTMLREALAEAVAMNRERLIVDVTRLRFCDVQSAHLILRADGTTPVHVTGSAGTVKRVLDLVDSLQRVPRDLAILDRPAGR